MSVLNENEADRARRRDAILDAAYRRFSHFGHRRTTMSDIASEAGIAGPGLYIYFRSKDDVFRAVCQRLHNQALAAARIGRANAGSLYDALRAVLAARIELALPLSQQPAEAAELLDENNRISGDICRAFRRAYMALLAHVFATADARDEVHLGHRQLSAIDAAALAHAGAHGLIADHVDPVTTHRRLDQLVTVLIIGLGGVEPRR